MTKEECHKNTQKMIDKLDKFKDDFRGFEINISKQISEIPNRLEARFDGRYANKSLESIVEKMETKYASKRVEKNFDKLVWLVVSAVLIGVLNLVIK